MDPGTKFAIGPRDLRNVFAIKQLEGWKIMHTGTTPVDTINRAGNLASKSIANATAAVSEEASDLGSRLSRVKDQISATVSDEVDMAVKYAEKAIDQIPDAVAYVEGGIRKHPFITAGVALGVGALAVNLMMRDKSAVRRH